MIPKIIHYCWFGRNKKTKLAEKCIASWKKYCPDYQIIEWNEDNFDVTAHPYARYCYQHQKWAFLSDYVRLAVISMYGGVYFDTDVELIKRIDKLLEKRAFYGFETPEKVATGLGFGAEKEHCTVKAMLEVYDRLQPDESGNYPLINCPKLNTEALIDLGLKTDGTKQDVAGALILPAEYMNPYDDPTGRLRVTENTISIHWFSKSWMKKSTIIRSQLTKPFHRVFGVDCFSKLRHH